MVDPTHVPTRKQAAELLGVTPPALTLWTREPWFPPAGRNADGSWNVPIIDQARQQANRKGSETSDAARNLKLATAAEKLKQNRITTQRQELELRERQGDLFPRAGVELFIASFLTAVGDDLDQLPAIVAKDVPTKQRKRVQSRLKDELDDLRKKWRDDLVREARERDLQMPSEHGRNE
jgi:hypothetical protein